MLTYFSVYQTTPQSQVCRAKEFEAWKLQTGRGRIELQFDSCGFSHMVAVCNLIFLSDNSCFWTLDLMTPKSHENKHEIQEPELVFCGLSFGSKTMATSLTSCQKNCLIMDGVRSLITYSSQQTRSRASQVTLQGGIEMI